MRDVIHSNGLIIFIRTYSKTHNHFRTQTLQITNPIHVQWQLKAVGNPPQPPHIRTHCSKTSCIVKGEQHKQQWRCGWRGVWVSSTPRQQQEQQTGHHGRVPLLRGDWPW